MDYKKILNQLPVPIYLTKEDGIQAIFFNNKWFQFTGLSQQEALTAWERVVDPRDSERIADIIRKAVENREGYEVEVRIKNADGDYIWCLSKACPFTNDDNEIEGYIGTTIDISQRKLAVRDLQEVYENVLNERQQKIKQLEQELEIHRTNQN